MRRAPLLLIVSLLAAAPVLSACENFDPDSLDFFHLNEKKKLPGDRKSVFPEGVPGVNQGVPPDLVKGYQSPPEATPAEATPEQKAAENPKPQRKPKPRVTERPTRIPAQPAAQDSSAQPPQQAAPAPPGTAAPNSPGTFQR